jgi:hypothetical protein
VLAGGRIRFVDCTSVFADGDSIKSGLFQVRIMDLLQFGNTAPSA